jgi:hypothetical protein
MKPRKFRDERAVSNVIGSILVVSLATISLVTVRFNYVPVWENQNEAEYTQQLEAGLLALLGGMQSLGANETATFGVPIALKQTKSSWMSGPKVPALADFGIASADVQLTAPTLRVHFQNGVVVPSLPETWTAAGSGTRLFSEIESLGDLRLRFHNITGKTNDQSTILQLRGNANQLLGTFTVYTQKASDGTFFIFRQSLDANNNVLYDQGDQYKLKGKQVIETYWVDALSPEFRFMNVVGVADRPFSLSISDDGLQAQYMISYTTNAAGLPQIIGGGGKTVPSFQETTRGSSFRLATRNQYYPDQLYTIENGALIVEQEGRGAVFLVPPQFQIVTGGSALVVSMTSFGVTGKSVGLGSTSNMFVRGTLKDTTMEIGSAPQFQLQVATQYPQLYTAFWQESLLAAGLTSSGCSPLSSSCQFIVGTVVDPDTGLTSARLDLYGYTVVDADPLAPVLDVQVAMRRAELGLAITQ